MGNIDQETGGTFNPEMLQNGKGPGAGIFQWENYSSKSDRWAGLNEFASSLSKVSKVSVEKLMDRFWVGFFIFPLILLL